MCEGGGENDYNHRNNVTNNINIKLDEKLSPNMHENQDKPSHYPDRVN